MTKKEKIALFLRQMSETRVVKSVYAPLLYRLLWKVGLEVKPPCFQSFFSLCLVFGSYFSIVLLCINLLFFGLGIIGISFVLIGSFIGAVLSSIGIAVYYRAQARNLNLPSWDNYGGD